MHIHKLLKHENCTDAAIEIIHDYSDQPYRESEMEFKVIWWNIAGEKPLPIPKSVETIFIKKSDWHNWKPWSK